MSQPEQAAPDEKHKLALASDFLTAGWQAECSCGWVSEKHVKTGDAHRAFDAHRREMANA